MRLQRSRLTQYPIAAGAALCLALLLAGCGVTSTASTTLGGAPAPSPTVTATNQPPYVGGSPCGGGETNASEISPSAVVLGGSSQGRTADAKVGDTVVVELPATMHWSYSNGGAAPSLTPATPFGALDTTRQLCLWAFHAAATGTATLTFQGSPRCRMGELCANYVLAQTYTVHVA